FSSSLYLLLSVDRVRFVHLLTCLLLLYETTYYSKFYAPLVGVPLLTPVASTAAVPTLASKDLHLYFHLILRFYFVLTTRPPWCTSVLNCNTLPIMRDTELYMLSTR
ncbi:hypothetical protein A2U01_0041378, partial [Trifolium medium]|nr:hypothetical protein [Trifolium medium]